MSRMTIGEIPTHHLESKPTSQSVKFAGVYINLTDLAVCHELDHSYLSRIFSGDRPDPSVSYSRKVAAALGMELGAFLEALKQKREARRALRAAQVAKAKRPRLSA